MSSDSDSDSDYHFSMICNKNKSLDVNEEKRESINNLLLTRMEKLFLDAVDYDADVKILIGEKVIVIL